MLLVLTVPTQLCQDLLVQMVLTQLYLDQQETMASQLTRLQLPTVSLEQKLSGWLPWLELTALTLLYLALPEQMVLTELTLLFLVLTARAPTRLLSQTVLLVLKLSGLPLWLVQMAKTGLTLLCQDLPEQMVQMVQMVQILLCQDLPEMTVTVLTRLLSQMVLLVLKQLGWLH